MINTHIHSENESKIENERASNGTRERERPEIVMLAADLLKKNCYYISYHLDSCVYVNTYTATQTHLKPTKN